MKADGQASLTIAFDPTRTRAVLRAHPDFETPLAQLSARFPGSHQREPRLTEIELDDLLAGISALSQWPAPESVTWADDLAQLVGEVLDDAEAAAGRLQGDSAPGIPEKLNDATVTGLLGDGWIGDLTAFQQRDIAKLLSLRHGANFSVPGAGKTRVGLAVYAAMRANGTVKRLLVVAPKSAFESWQAETATCFTEPPYLAVMDSLDVPGAEILLVNYERLARAVPLVAAWLRAAPAMMILDEAHRMKLGARGRYGAACMALGPLSRRRLILTGTPAPNGARDLENLLSFVWPGHGRHVVTSAVAGGDLSYASQVLRPLFTRTTKAELGLPGFEPKIRYVEMPPLHREIYDALIGQFSARAEASRHDFDSLGRALLRLLMAATSPALLVEGSSRHEPLLYQVPPLEPAPGDSLASLMRRLPSYEFPPKYKEALSIVSSNARKGRKTLVWSNFVRNLTTLRNVFHRFQPAMIHGGTEDRGEQLDRFRNDSDCAVLLSNPATLGEGISLHQHCNDAVYIDRDFMAGRFLQSLDRIHRLGLKPGTETNVTILVTPGTVDEIVAHRLEEKLKFMGLIMDDPAVQQLGDLQEEVSVAGGMDIEDVQALLSHLSVR
ncbi:hypothetical protein BTM25_10840 [Actinomadura rubteroloni]|uniref:Helicase ATP-binding domain-containing protein n=1 Tax=Actinomadura rubteroloni TaxID=1926885 RepID=A0A2P4UNQ6_9ACTN|nr:SNF2-related protein [Actinomadura rubteroloni]POM26680.1 hypothetical protein BTM25_10840 [Actinomadura rubteroloni]